MMRFLTLLLCLISPAVFAAGMPMAENLQQTYAKAGHDQTGKDKVVLMLVSQPNCTYCLQISEEILKPMLISGDYKGTTVFSELEINTGKEITDFAGQAVDATKFARRYNAWATPTLLFLDGEGNEVAEKMVGINTLELYGYYVDRSINRGFVSLNP